MNEGPKGGRSVVVNNSQMWDGADLELVFGTVA